MACLIPTGMTYQDDSCNGAFGGLVRLWLANKREVSAILKNSDNVITGITMAGSAKFYEFTYDETIGAGFEQSLNADAGGFVNHTINLVIRNINQAKKNILSQMKRGKFVAICESADGSLWLAGESKGLRATTGDLSTGQAETDQAGLTLSLSAAQLDYADSILATAVQSVVDNF